MTGLKREMNREISPFPTGAYWRPYTDLTEYCKFFMRSYASYKAFPVYGNKLTCNFYSPTGNKFQSSPKRPFPVRVTLCLCFETRLGAKPFMRKWVWFAWKWTCRWNTFPYEWFRTKTRFSLFWYRQRTTLKRPLGKDIFFLKGWGWVVSFQKKKICREKLREKKSC